MSVMTNKSLKINVFSKILLSTGIFVFMFSFGQIALADNLPSVNIFANNSANSITINQGDSFTLNWTSTDAASCELSFNGQAPSGVSLNDQAGPIDPGHPYYPQQSEPSMFTISCADSEGFNGITSSVIVSLSEQQSPPESLPAPTLSASSGAQCGGTIDLSWSTVTSAALYSLNRDDAEIVQTASVTYTDSNLMPDSSHTYTVTATNGTIVSPASNPAGAFASSVCSASSTPTTFNDDPDDFPTVRVSNFTEHPFSTTDWALSITANPGDIVAIGVYYHNTGNVDAQNTKVAISVPVGTSTTNFTVSGDVSADNASVVGGSATITLPSNQTLTYVSGSAKWYPNQTQDPSQGIALPDYSLNNIGTVPPGWPTQGMVIAQFQVSNNAIVPPAPGAMVDITANNSQGPITISTTGQFTLEWASSNVISCALSSTDGIVAPSGVNTNGQTSAMSAGHPYFPASGTSRTFVINCDVSGGGQVSNSVTVSVQDGGGGGGSTPALVLTGQTGTQCGGTVDLSWTNISGTTFYKIFRNGTQISTTTNLSFTDTGLSPGQTYSYYVVASNSAGDSAPSATVSPASSAACVGVPATPVVVLVTAGPQCGGQMIISWSPVANALSYKVLRDGLLVATVSTSSTFYIDNGLAPGSSHSYSIIASNAQGDSAPSLPVQGFASNACSSPVTGPPLSGVTGPNCGGEIVLSWNAVGGVTAYKIFRSFGGGVFFQIGISTNLSFIDTGLSTSTAYQYYVIATVGGVDSSPSNIVSVVSSGPCTTPPAPPTLSGNTGPVCGGQIVLNWMSSPTAASYNILRDNVLLATTTNLSFTDTVTPNTAFSYVVQAVNNAGASVNSNTVTVTSSAACGGGGGPLLPTVILTASPNPIFAGATTTLSWTSTNANICNAIGGWTTATSTSGTGVVSPATTTIFGITCTGAGGSATASTTVTVLPASASSAPTNLAAATGAQCGGQIDLSWTASLGATFYNVIRGGAFVASTTNLSFTNTGLNVRQSYSYTVQAGNQFGTSTDSNVATAASSAACGSGSSGGGGGGGGGRVLSTTPVSGGTLPGPCNYLRDYLRIDFQNDPIEVMKLQIFLINIENETDLQVNGVFDQQTFDAIARFQVKYQPDVLTPWGYTQGEYTGYVYILTKKKINEIVCNSLLNLAPGQLSEISNFKAFLESLRTRGIEVPEITAPNVNEEISAVTSTTTGVISRITGNPNVKALAAAVFAGPQGFRNTLKMIFVFLLVLIAAYVVAEESLKRFLKTDDKDAERLRRLSIVVSALVAAMVVAATLKYFVIILPLVMLIFALIIFATWVILKKKKTETTNKMKGFGSIPPSVIIIPPPVK